MDCSLPGFSVHGILQARILEGFAISFSNAWKWKVKVKLLSCDPMDCSPRGSSVHGIFQARVLEWGAIATLPKYFLFPTFPFLQTFLRKVSYFLAASCLLRLRHLALITVMTAGTMAGLTECLLCTRLSAYCLAHVISVNSHNSPLSQVLLLF